jgi:hypothetical protein
VECAANDSLSDAFTERAGEWGINVFRLFDRIHQFHGKSVRLGLVLRCVYS